MSDFSKIILIVENIPGYDGGESIGEYNRQPNDILAALLSPEIRQPAISAGASESLLQQLIIPDIPLLERWVKFQPYWERIVNCAPAAIFNAAIKLVTENELSAFTINDINRSFTSPDNVAVLRKAGLARCVCGVDNLNSGLDNEIFCSVYNIENFVCPECEHVRKSLEQLAGMKIVDFDDWIQATELAVNKLTVNGIAALRISVPVRNLANPSYADAEAAFNKLLDGTFEGKDVLCRYMIRHVMRLCQRLCLCVQMHNIAIPDYAEARAFFMEYHKVKFDIMTDRFLYHVKYLPNVYWNVGRLCALKPCHAARVLGEVLLEVPVNKISILGSGLYHSWLAAGAAVRTRRLLAMFLYNLLRQGVANEKRIEIIARMWLYENPAMLYEKNYVSGNNAT